MNKTIAPYLAAGGGIVGALLLFLLRTLHSNGTPAPASRAQFHESSPAAMDVGSVHSSEKWPTAPVADLPSGSMVSDTPPASGAVPNADVADVPPTRAAILDSTRKMGRAFAATTRPAPEPAAAVADPDPAGSERVRMPLALLAPAPSLTRSEDQDSALANLRQQFSDAVGGPNQDPDDAGYRERWQRAQPTLDEQFWTLFGQDAYMQHARSRALSRSD